MPITGKLICSSHSPEWYAQRSKSIGASEAAAACGVSPYQQPADVYYLKRGEVEPPDETDEMWFGSNIEGFIWQYFLRKKPDVEILEQPTGCYQHPEHHWMTATPDAHLKECGSGDDSLGESKSLDEHYARQLGVREGGELPRECSGYIMQAQQQMAVCGLELVHIPILVGRKLLPYRCHRSDRLIALIVRVTGDLWERIESGNPPEMDWEHRSTRELQSKLFNIAESTRIEATAEDFALVERDRELKAQKRDIEKERETIRGKLAQRIGNHGGLLLPDGKEIRRIKMAETIVPEHVKKAHFQLRERNAKDGAIILPAEAEEMKALPYDAVHVELLAAGYMKYEHSPADSCYYIHKDDARRVRVADHAANKKTAAWMNRHDVSEVRVDLPEWETDLQLITEGVTV